MMDKAKNLQEDVRESAHRIWLAGLGALTMAGDEGQKLFKSLVEKGEALEARQAVPTEAVKRTLETAKDRAEDLFGRVEGIVNDKVVTVLQRMGVPTRDEIQQLTQRVDSLMEAIQKLNLEEKKDA